mgnify:CR=1 FL=1
MKTRPPRNIWRQLIACERGDTSPLAMILILTIVVIGVIVGLASLRDSVVQEYGDVAVLLDNLNQSVSAQVFDDGGNLVWESSYTDPGSTLVDDVDTEPACLTISAASIIAEGDPPPAPTGAFP